MERAFQTLLTVVCGLTLVGSLLIRQPWLPIVSVVSGAPFAIAAAWTALKERRLDVNVLMVLAGAGAVALGHPVEAAVLLFLFSLSSTLEEYAMARTKSAIEGLVRLRPDTATLVSGDEDKIVQVRDVRPGDRVRVRPFEQVPLDGVVVLGSSQIDQAVMTGESTPVSKQPGDRVIGGTQNLDGMLVLEVEAAVGDTTLEKIVELVRDAQENKASGERISQWFGQRYTVFVLAAAALSIVVRLALGEEWGRNLYASLTLLVALSPCALVISTPATTLSALAWAARHGILVRGGEFVERAGSVRTVIFDKTGTLTTGRPVLDELCVCGEAPVAVGGSHCKEEDACWSRGQTMSAEAQAILRVAAAAEQYSTHPIAEAIVAEARSAGLDVPEAVEPHDVSGMGVRARVDGRPVRVGQVAFFPSLPDDFLEHARAIQRAGMTVAVLETEGKYAALGLRDAPRSEAKEVVDDLKRLGLARPAMLTGDNKETALSVARELGIDDVRAGLLPQDKESQIAEAERERGGVLFVGDGINDAPSLARASVGVAMGGLGSDVALNAADVVLMQDNLRRLPDLVRLGRRTNRTVRANLVFATSVIGLLTLGTICFDAFLPAYRHAVLPLAVVGHEGSTVLVILNGLRLLADPRR